MLLKITSIQITSVDVRLPYTGKCIVQENALYKKFIYDQSTLKRRFQSYTILEIYLMHVCIAQNVTLTDHLGLSTYLKNITRHLEDDELKISLVIQKGPNNPDGMPDNIAIYQIDSNLYSVKANLDYTRKLNSILNSINRDDPIDLIHCLYPYSSVAGAALFKRKHPSTRIVYDLRSPWIEMSVERGSVPVSVSAVYRRLAYLLERFLSTYVDGFIFITQGLFEFYKQKIKPGNRPVVILPSGIDLESFSCQKNLGLSGSSYLTDKDMDLIDKDTGLKENYSIREDDILLGYVGAISSMRELSFILSAFEQLPDNYRLMFVGDGDDRVCLEELSGKYGLKDRVIFTGKVPHNSIVSYISLFDVGLCHLPDRFVFRHSFPMKILEYLACGIPVLASDIKAHSDIAARNKNIYLYNNKTTFIDQLKNIEYIPSEDIDSYSWEAVCDGMVKFWKQL